MSLDDERVAFYLRNRERIEEWSALRGAAAAAIDEWLTALRPDIEHLARDLGADVGLHAAFADDNPWPRYRLTRSTWADASVEDPPVSICLEWGRGRTTLFGTGTPYAGVRSPKAHKMGTALRESAELRRLRTQRKDITGPWWAAYGYVQPDTDFPASAAGYRERLVERLRDAWTAYAPLIDAVMSAPG